MKDLGETSYVFRIKLLRDRKNKALALSQAMYIEVYIEKILKRFSIENSKKNLLLFRHGIPFPKEQYPKIDEKKQNMRKVSYAESVGSLIYAMSYTNQIFITLLVWWTDINLIMDRHIRLLSSIL